MQSIFLSDIVANVSRSTLLIIIPQGKLHTWNSKFALVRSLRYTGYTFIKYLLVILAKSMFCCR